MIFTSNAVIVKFTSLKRKFKQSVGPQYVWMPILGLNGRWESVAKLVRALCYKPSLRGLRFAMGSLGVSIGLTLLVALSL
jgi:hypothetical protein